MDIKSGFVMLLCLAAAVGCARSSAEQNHVSENSKYILAMEPAGAIDVIDVREKAKDGDLISVRGRIESSVKPWIEGRAAFLLVDERLVSNCDDTECADGCTQCAAELAEATTMVKFVDAEGKVLAVDARQLLGLRERQTVVVRGIAKRDKSGNVSIVAEGIHVRG